MTPLEFKNSLENLTQKEKIIVKLISEGFSTKEIADKLFNSIRTIEKHRQNIAFKLDQSGQGKLLLFLLENKSSILEFFRQPVGASLGV